MTGKTHQTLGMAIGVSQLIFKEPNYNPATFFAVLATSYIAALLPDIDQPTGKVWDILPFGNKFGQIADPFLKHRNISHSLLGLVFVVLLAHQIIGKFPDYWNIQKTTCFLAFSLAYGSHLFADMFTVQGIPLLFPYKRMFGLPPKPFDGIRIQTGKWFENLVIYPIVNIYLIAIVIYKWDVIKRLLLK